MTTLSYTYNFTAGTPAVAAEVNSNFNSVASVVNGNIDNTNIKAGAGIVDTKLAQITTASKVSGTALTGLASIPSGAGVVPVANIGTGTPDGTKYLKDDGSFTALAVATAASEAEMEAGTENAKAVTPLVAKHNQGAAKAWAVFSSTGSTGAVTADASYNVSGVVKDDVGKVTVSWDTNFASANYAILVTCDDTDTTGNIPVIHSKAAGTCEIYIKDVSNNFNDCAIISVVAFGLQ